MERRAPAGQPPLATLESPPLYDIVRDVNKLSNNVMARQVFLSLALDAAPPPATTGKGGRRRAPRARAAAASRCPKLVMENGSGLSRNERITAGGLVRLLVAADRSAVREDFASSLAVAAVDGTVERRFLTGPVAGQALLKTGSLEGVRALAGYVLDAAGHRACGGGDHQRPERRARRRRRSTRWCSGSTRTRRRGTLRCSGDPAPAPRVALERRRAASMRR